MNKIHTLSFNENTYTLVPLGSTNENYSVYKNGIDTNFLLLFKDVNKWNPNPHFQLYVVQGVQYEIPSSTNDITIKVMCDVISLIK